MSETQEQPGPETEAPVPAPEAPPEAPQEDDPKEVEGRLTKRIAFLRAQATTAQRERDQFAARLAAVEAQARAGANGQGQPQYDAALQQAIQAEAQRIAGGERIKERIESFHSAGREAYADWPQRMTDLQSMGADPGFAQLLIEMPNGHKVAAALRDEPDELERIAAMSSERSRAIALGQYAAKLAATPARQVSRAPAPPRPVQGRVAPQFDPYQETDTNKLVDYFRKQDFERRRAQ